MNQQKSPTTALVVLAFAAVYIIWGSTYFFIEMSVKHIPPMIIGAIRFLAAGIIMLSWFAIKGEKIWNPQAIMHSAVSGVLMLFIGNGAVIWAEQYLPSSFVAIFLASAPVWFLIFDKPKWAENFSNKFTLISIVIGLIGVIALFYEKIAGGNSHQMVLPLLALILANIGWVIGSLYSKYKVKGVSASVNSAWQILSAGIVFSIGSVADGSIGKVDWQTIPLQAWGAVAYLIVFGSIIGYSAYVFLLSVRNSTQVSSYAYVNPLVAVLLGVLINSDVLTTLQISGLFIILFSVLFVNMAKRSSEKKQLATS